MTDKIREWFGDIEATRERIDAFWAGGGRFLITVETSAHGYRQDFDEAGVLGRIGPNLKAESEMPGANMPVIFADWGTISTAKYWGGEVKISDEYIFVEPAAQTIDEALALSPRPVDDPEMDAYKAVARYRAVSESLGTDALWLRTPDMQGTLNTAGLIMNQDEFLMALYTETEKVHTFLGRVSDFLIEYALYLRRETHNHICGNIWPYTFFPSDLGLSLTEDLMPLLSAEKYAEFGIPYLLKLQQALGALHIHCCGKYGHHVENLRKSGLKLKALEFHYPATTLEELEPLAEDTVFIPYIILHKQEEFASTVAFYRHLIEHAGPEFRFWFACADDSEEMLAFAEEYAAG
jgi:hypothetical protein